MVFGHGIDVSVQFSGRQDTWPHEDGDLGAVQIGMPSSLVSAWQCSAVKEAPWCHLHTHKQMITFIIMK